MKKYIFSILAIVLIVLCNVNFKVANARGINEPDEKIISNNDFIICIDPGHQSKPDFRGEPIAPGSSNKKNRVSAGTRGIATKRFEYEVNLEASLILKAMLLDKGYNVIMTRETNDVNISNAERAEIANNANATMTIRIHCDSIDNSSKTGATILIPGKNNKNNGQIYNQSKRYGEILKENLKIAGIKTNGVHERSDITGFNWSKVPVIILEMGFMSNWNEDNMLSDTEYQKKIMECIVLSIEQYKSENINSN